LKNYTKLVFKSFSFEARKKEKFLDYRLVPEEFINFKQVPVSLSLTASVHRRTPGMAPHPLAGQVGPQPVVLSETAPLWDLPRMTRALDSSIGHHAADGINLCHHLAVELSPARMHLPQAPLPRLEPPHTYK